MPLMLAILMLMMNFIKSPKEKRIFESDKNLTKSFPNYNSHDGMNNIMYSAEYMMLGFTLNLTI